MVESKRYKGELFVCLFLFVTTLNSVFASPLSLLFLCIYLHRAYVVTLPLRLLGVLFFLSSLFSSCSLLRSACEFPFSLLLRLAFIIHFQIRKRRGNQT